MESSQVIISFSIISRCHLLCIPSLCEYKWGSSENETEKNSFFLCKTFWPRHFRLTKKIKKAFSEMKGIFDKWQTSGRCSTLNFESSKTSQV